MIAAIGDHQHEIAWEVKRKYTFRHSALHWNPVNMASSSPILLRTFNYDTDYEQILDMFKCGMQGSFKAYKTHFQISVILFLNFGLILAETCSNVKDLM